MDDIQWCAQLAVQGMTRAQVDALPRIDGLWGVRQVAAAPDPRLTRIHAALAVAPVGAVLAGWAAGVLHGVPDGFLDGTFDGTAVHPVDFIVAPGAGLWQRHGIRLRRGPVRPADLLRYRGHLVTGGTRTAVDMARWTRRPERALAMVDMSLRHRLTTTGELIRLISTMKGYLGIQYARTAVPIASDRAESPKESELRYFWLEAGLPTPLVNADIFDLRGLLLGRVDLLDPESGYVGEYNGHWHQMWTRPEEDRIRIKGLRSLNLTVDEFTKVHVGGAEFGGLSGMLHNGLVRALTRDARHDAWYCPQATHCDDEDPHDRRAVPQSR